MQDVQNPTHLRENEDSRTFLLHGTKYFIKNDHLACIVDDVLVGSIRKARFLMARISVSSALKEEDLELLATYSSVEQIGMTRYFTKLHDHIHEPCLAPPFYP